MSKKLLAILGGPLKDGNASKMLQTAMQAAEKNGWHVDFVWLYEQNIDWCKGCMGCKKTGVCIINDDIVPIREKLIACDAVVLAAPTYFANVPGIVKNFFDRMVGAVMDDNDSPIPKPRLRKTQRYLLLTTCNTPFPFHVLAGQSSGTLKAMKEFFHISGMQKMGTVVFAGTRGKSCLPPSVIKKIERYWK